MKKVIVLSLITTLIVACARVPITGRRQVNLLPESEMISMSLTAYSDFLSQNPPMSDASPDAQMVKRLGARIQGAVTKFLEKEGQTKRIENFAWEFNLVDDPTINAWCMPGGKVVVYSGILDVAQDEKGLAAVMGHEIAHAIARHGNERMSQQLLIQAGGVTLGALVQEQPALAQELFALSYGVGTGLGSLAFSRNHETEADKMGLIFMAMAGYDPHEAVKFWERMSASGGAEPPEFLSTHPNHDTRVNDLNAFMPEAMKYYETPN
ncbi:MAG: M48 family metallopeptidase [Flavobacteriales bacterium]|nr:M48 family metallopeptidase [Flavobacteriales bacterium]